MLFRRFSFYLAVAGIVAGVMMVRQLRTPARAAAA